MSRKYNKVDTNIDLSLFNLKSDKVSEEVLVKKQAHKSISKIDVIEDIDNRSISIEQAMKILNQQWKLSGLRSRTIQTYNYNFNRFVEVTKVEYLSQINSQKIYDFLASLGDVKDSSLNGVLKQIKAVLSKCHDNGWYESRFWKNVKIKVNKTVKEAATEQEITLLLSLLDKSTYSGMRDSIAIILLVKTGIRIKTLGELREGNIDFDNQLLKLQGDIMKSHKPLFLPLSNDMCTLLKELITVNEKLRREHKQKNDYIFLSNTGVPISNTVSSSNLIAKNLWVYSKKWGLKNVNAHSLRRLFAQNLVNHGADINLVSHALAHSDLTTTSIYLGLNPNTVAKNLRDYI